MARFPKAKFILSIVIASTMLSLESCSRKFVGYVTSTQNIPLLSKGGQGQVMGALGLNHFEGQMSVSPVKYTALMANLYSGVNGQSTELGGGFYATTKSGFVFEIIGLRIKSDMSRRSTKIYKVLSEHVDAEIQTLKAKYDGYSAQFDIGYKMNLGNTGSSSMGIGFKFSQVHYDSFEYDRKYYTYYQESNQSMTSHDHISLPQSKLNFLSISPTARFGIGPAHMFMQFSAHISLDNYKGDLKSFPLYSQQWLTIGVEFRFNEGVLERIKKKSNEENPSPE